jgi:deazaflavin-dependent oxidoreductase (nitroreductase family)
MAGTDEVLDSPTGWVASHIKSYVESDGSKGHRYHGYDALLLTTRGRKSGKLRRTALYYGVEGDRYLLVASNGGSEEHPQWYRNLAADPAVTVQVGPEVFTANARTATPEERPALWDLMVSVFDRYALYQKQAPREIPVIILERAEAPAGSAD